MSLFDHSFNQFFVTEYENYWRHSILFPLCKMTGELESGVLGHLYEHLGDLKSFIEDFYHYF